MLVSPEDKDSIWILYGAFLRPGNYSAVADSLELGAREDAKTGTVRNVRLLIDLYQSEISRTIGAEELRRQLVFEVGIPKEDIEKKQLKRLERHYEAAYPYLERTMNTQSPSQSKAEEVGEKEQQQTQTVTEPQRERPSRAAGGDNIIRIDGLTLDLDDEDIAEEWERAKTTIDAYLKTSSGK